ncbi:hypothetical protein [Nonomuraea sp. NPDC052265]|uniref:hypothetical protein n=1 Tax=Nonomuraea sp. NPDC052265 TaxID=3364374 RepID=UPI0037CC2BC6
MTDDQPRADGPPREQLWPAASVFMQVDHEGRVLLSFDRTPDTTKVGLELPQQADRLVAMHVAVVRAARMLTGAKSESDAIRLLLELAKREERERLRPATKVTEPAKAWRSTPLPDLKREYPVGKDRDPREIPSGLPDSNRQRH